MNEKDKKALALICTVVLMLTLVIVAGIGSSWFTNGNVLYWFNMWGKGIERDNTSGEVFAYSDTGQVLHDGGVYFMPASMTIVCHAASADVPDSELILVASMTDTYINEKFEFTYYFENSGSAWAYGKNVLDYIEIAQVPETDDQLKLSFKEAFAEPIIIRATKENSISFLTCKINCVQRVTQLAEIVMDGTDIDDETGIEFAVNYSTGTVKSNVTLNSVILTLDSDFIDEIKKRLDFDAIINGYSYDVANSEVELRDNYISVKGGKLSYSMFIVGFNNLSQQQKDSIYHAWNEAYISYGRENNVNVDISIIYGFESNVFDKVTKSVLHVGKITGYLYRSQLDDGKSPDGNLKF